MSVEANFVTKLLQAGSTVEINATKWSDDSLRSFAQTAKRTNATLIFRNISIHHSEKLSQIASLGGSALHFDLSK